MRSVLCRGRCLTYLWPRAHTQPSLNKNTNEVRHAHVIYFAEQPDPPSPTPNSIPSPPPPPPLTRFNIPHCGMGLLCTALWWAMVAVIAQTGYSCPRRDCATVCERGQRSFDTPLIVLFCLLLSTASFRCFVIQIRGLDWRRAIRRAVRTPYGQLHCPSENLPPALLCACVRACMCACVSE